MKRLRRILFWAHFSLGVIAGVVILVMSLTGALLAFKPQIQRFVDRDVRIVQPPRERAARLGVQTMIGNVRLAKTEGQLQSIALESDPTSSAAVSLGREATVYVDPYTGRVAALRPHGGTGRHRRSGGRRPRVRWRHDAGVDGLLAGVAAAHGLALLEEGRAGPP